MKKCPYCKSILVCWNWMHQTKEKLQEYNSHLDIKNDEWYHECWDCDSINFTSYKVTNGIYYWLLKIAYKYFGDQ